MILRDALAFSLIFFSASSFAQSDVFNAALRSQVARFVDDPAHTRLGELALKQSEVSSSECLMNPPRCRQAKIEVLEEILKKEIFNRSVKWGERTRLAVIHKIIKDPSFDRLVESVKKAGLTSIPGSGGGVTQ